MNGYLDNVNCYSTCSNIPYYTNRLDIDNKEMILFSHESYKRFKYIIL